MKKHTLALTLLPFLLAGCVSGKDPIKPYVPTTNQEIFKLRRETSIVADTCFKNGFNLISPESTNQYHERVIDYNGERDTYFYKEDQYKTYWSMCQWWTPFNFKDAEYRKEGKKHVYENESRYLSVDTTTGELRMKLDADKEYQELYPDNGGVKPASASWSHFLIQQTFPQDIAVFPADVDEAGNELHITFDITVNNYEYKKEGNPVGSDCAQLMFYLLIRNNVPADSDPAEVGVRNKKMWFGFPIMDTRYNFISEYKAGDNGFEGATGHLICSMNNRGYFDEPFQIGKKYHIDFNVLDFMKQYFIWGVQNNYLPNCVWQNMFLDYMNFGWEIPGNYSVDSTIDNLDIYVC